METNLSELVLHCQYIISRMIRRMLKIVNSLGVGWSGFNMLMADLWNSNMLMLSNELLQPLHNAGIWPHASGQVLGFYISMPI